VRAAGDAGAVMIRLRDVTKTFGPHAALAEVSLSVDAGTTHVLLGVSGSGKSTILRLVLGLLLPERGSIAVDGVPVTAATRREVTRRIGYVVQEDALYPHLTATGNVALPARALGWPADRITARVADLTALVGLERDRLDRYPAELSGGQRQRVGLMRALMLDPPILLLDEPLGALDPITRSELQGHLVELFRQLGKTVLLVTHDVREAFLFGAVITLLDRGRIVQQGSFRDLVQRPAEPFVAQFLRAQTPPPEMAEYLARP